MRCRTALQNALHAALPQHRRHAGHTADVHLAVDEMVRPQRQLQPNDAGDEAVRMHNIVVLGHHFGRQLRWSGYNANVE